MLAGQFMAQRNVFDLLENGWRKKEHWILVISCLVIGLVLIFLFPTQTGYNNGIYGDYGGWSVIPFFPLSLACCIVILAIVGWFAKIPLIGSMFSYIGKHTLAIFLLHTFWLRLIIAPFHTIPAYAFFPRMSIPEVAVFGIAALILSLLTAEVCGRLLTKIKAGRGKPSGSKA